jgi:hypothetical protein
MGNSRFVNAEIKVYCRVPKLQHPYYEIMRLELENKTINTGFEAFAGITWKLLSDRPPIRHFSIATPFEISENKGLLATYLLSGEMG